MSQYLPLAIFGLPGGAEWIVIGIIALLLFGNRLPKVARSLGQALNEFKSGLTGKVDESDTCTPKNDKDVVNVKNDEKKQ